MDIQKYGEAFEVFFHCYLEVEESVADFFADRWAEGMEGDDIRIVELRPRPLESEMVKGILEAETQTEIKRVS